MIEGLISSSSSVDSSRARAGQINSLSLELFELLLLGFCYGLVCYRYYRSQVHLLPVVLVVRCAPIHLLCGVFPSMLTVCVISEVDGSNGWLFPESVAGCLSRRV